MTLAHHMIGVVCPRTKHSFTVLAASPNRAKAAQAALEAVRRYDGLDTTETVLVAWGRELTPQNVAPVRVGDKLTHPGLPTIGFDAEVLTSRALPGKVA